MSDENIFKVNDKRGQEKEAGSTGGDANTESTEPEVHSGDISPQSLSANDQSPTSQGIPQASFTNFLASMGTSCMMHLGLIKDPNATGDETNLDMAQHEIDLLSILQEKTKGNLSKEEDDLLTQLLYELRVNFVKHKK